MFACDGLFRAFGGLLFSVFLSRMIMDCLQVYQGFFKVLSCFWCFNTKRIYGLFGIESLIDVNNM